MLSEIFLERNKEKGKNVHMSIDQLMITRNMSSLKATTEMQTECNIEAHYELDLKRCPAFRMKLMYVFM